MARTDAGALLTAQHRRAQTQLRAAALRDYLRIWPVWDGTPAGFARLITATLPLVRAHHRLSAAVASAYYQSFRLAEATRGAPTPKLAPLNDQAVAASLYVTGRVMTARALAAGQSPQAAMQTALVRTSGAVGRHVLNGGRGTLVASTQADPHAHGYQRVLSPGACDFCQEIADEGTATGDFQAHDHCSCAAEPIFT